MQPPRPARNYEAIRETENEVGERLAAGAAIQETAVSETSAAEQPSVWQTAEARLADYRAELQDLVDRGKITPREMVYREAKFDNKLVVEMNIEALREARDAVAATRGDDHSRAHEIDEPER
ncbi:MAG: hypothetical protein AB7R40_24900 [Nitrospiraceae bacterium]